MLVSGKPGVRENVRCQVINTGCTDPRFDFPDRGVAGFADGGIGPFHHDRRFAFYNRARQVTEIAGGGDARKDVHDQRLVWTDWPGPGVMGIRPLTTRGHNGVGRDAAET